MRRWARLAGRFLVLAAVVTTAATGCSSTTAGQPSASGSGGQSAEGPEAPPSVSPSPLLERTPFRSERGGFTIQPPKGWTADDGGRFGTDVIFLNPRGERDRSGAFASNVTVLRTPAAPSLEVLTGTVKAQVAEQFPGYQVVEDEPADTIGGQRAHLLGGRFTQNRQQLRDLRLIVVDGDRGLVVTGTTLESFFFRNEETFRASLPTLAP